MQVLLYDSIDMLSLAIGLQMEGRRNLLLDVKQVSQ